MLIFSIYGCVIFRKEYVYFLIYLFLCKKKIHKSLCLHTQVETFETIVLCIGAYYMYHAFL